jgi:hypothetical protein
VQVIGHMACPWSSHYEPLLIRWSLFLLCT